MSTNGTLLCIHRNPDHLSLLQQNGYEVLTATTGGEGLRLFMSRPVDAIVLDYQLGLLDGALVAAEIKKVKPQLPIVMLADHRDCRIRRCGVSMPSSPNPTLIALYWRRCARY